MTDEAARLRADLIERAEHVLIADGLERPEHGWTEASLADAINRRGWTVSCGGETGAWLVTIVVRDDGTGSCETLSGDPDRSVAILTAFALAVSDDKP